MVRSLKILLLFFLVLFSSPGLLQAESLLSYKNGEVLKEDIKRLEENLGEDPQQYIELALALAKSLEPLKMEEVLREGLERFPANLEMRKIGGALYEELRYRSKAIALYQELLDLAVEDAAQYYNKIAYLYYELAEADLALENSLKALNSAPSPELYRQIRQDYFTYQKVIALTAEDFFALCQRALPREVRVSRDLAGYLEDQGRWEEALEIYGHIQSQNPFNPSYHDYLRLLKEHNKENFEVLLTQGVRPLDHLLAGLYQYEQAMGPWRHQPQAALAKARQFFARWLASFSNETKNKNQLLLASFLNEWGDWHWAQELYLKVYLEENNEIYKKEALLGLASSFAKGGVTDEFLAWPQGKSQPLLNIFSGILSFAMDKTIWQKTQKDLVLVQQNYIGKIIALEIYEYYLNKYGEELASADITVRKLELMAELKQYDEVIRLADEMIPLSQEEGAIKLYRLKARIHGRREEHLKAAECYQKILALNPKAAERDEVFALLIQQYSLLNEFLVAEKAYRQEALKRTDDIRFWYDYAHFQRVRFKNEISIYEEMLSYFPADSSLLGILSRAYEERGETEKMLATLAKGAIFNNDLAREYLSKLMKLDLFAQKKDELLQKNDYASQKLLGDIYLYLSQPQKALEYYQSLREITPHRLDILEPLAHLARSLGNWQEAASLLTDWHYFAPTNPSVLVLLGEVYVEGERFTEAKEAWQNLINIHLLDGSLYLECANVHYDYYFNEEARKAILSCRKNCQDPEFAALALATIWEEEGNWQEAFKEYLGLINGGNLARLQRDELLEHFEKLNEKGQLNIIKEAFQNYYDKGKATLSLYIFERDLYLRIERRDLAEEILNRAGKRKWTLPEYFKLANSWRELSKYDKEEEILLKAFSEFGDNEEILRNLANNYQSRHIYPSLAFIMSKLYYKTPDSYRNRYLESLISLQDFKEAQRVLAEAISKEPDKIALFLKKAELYHLEGKNKEAQAAQEEALQVAKRNNKAEEIVQAHLARAKLQTLLNNPAQARDEYIMAINSRPLYVPLLRQAYLELESLGELPAFFKFYEETAKQAERDYRWQMLLYHANRYRGDFSGRLEALEKVLALEPHRLDLKENLAWEYWRLGNLEEAQKGYLNLLESQEEGPTKRIQSHLLEIYLQEGKRKEALELFSNLVPINNRDNYLLIDWARKAIDYGFFEKANELIKEVEKRIEPAERRYFYALTDAKIKLAQVQGNLQSLLPDLQNINSYTLMGFARARSVYDEIKERLRQEALATPQMTTGIYKYLDLVLKKGEWEEAVNLLKKIIDASPQEFQWYLRLADLYEERCLWEPLLELGEMTTLRHPWQVEGYLWLIKGHLAKGEEEALRICTMIPELPVLNQDRYLSLVNLLKDFSYFKEALTYLDLAEDLGGKTNITKSQKIILSLQMAEKEIGKKMLLAYLAEEEKDPHPALEISCDLTRINEYDLAKIAFDHSLIIAQKEGWKSFPLYYQVKEQRKTLFTKLGLGKEMLDFYEEMYEQETNYWERLELARYTAEVLMSLKEWQKTIDICQSFRLEQPLDNQLFKYLIQSLEEMNQGKEALVLLKERLSKEPQSQSNYLEYGDLLYRQGEEVAALKAIQDLFNNFPRQSGTFAEGMRRLIQWGFASAGGDLLEQLLLLEPTNQNLRLLYVEYCLATNKVEEGLKAQEYLLPLVTNPHNEAYLLRLRSELLVKGNLAKSRLKELARITPKTVLLTLEEAFILIDSEDWQGARKALTEGLIHYPNEIVLYPGALQIARYFADKDEEERLLAKLRLMDPYGEQWAKDEMKWLPRKDDNFEMGGWEFDSLGGDY